MLDRLGIDLRVVESEWAKIPAKGPVVVVANHPFGILEGAAIMSRLPGVRQDVRVLANSVLTTVPEVADFFIPVDVFRGREAVQANQRGLRQSLEWLKKGGVLVVFPAGEVSHLQWNKFSITDPEWSTMIARLIRRTNATAVPMYVKGSNSALFQILGLLHPKVRTALLPHEYLNKQNSRVEIRVGSPVPPARVAASASDEVLTRYLRWRTYLLEHRQGATAPVPAPLDSSARRAALSIRQEVESLPSARCLVAQGDTRVYIATAQELRYTLDEIGELREITFRAAGEGTGKSKDLDEYDQHYLHLFSWDAKRGEVIGAYRLGQTDEILRRCGIRGLYTSTLFQYTKDFLLEIHPALEMGRSFIRAEYQRSFSALLLLWKGIGHFIVEHPRYRVLFGPVSISNDYNPLSRKFLVDYLEQNLRDERLSRMVKPRKPFRRFLAPTGADWHIDLEELSSIIGDLEEDGKGVPVLLRQYLKLGGRLLSFNVDPKFSRCLDGLIVVDLARTDRAMLNRYMGVEGADSFLNIHRELVA
jgi:putative hemolysin